MHDVIQTTVGESPATPELCLNPTQLAHPAFLVNFPFSLSAGVANNKWMEDIPDAERRIDIPRAMSQFLALFRFISAEALVYVLPTPRDCRCQDLPYTANLGAVLAHTPDRMIVVVSNFTSEPRRAESDIGLRFFELMGYDAVVSPFRFEGEAELKHLYDNVYIGGYGARSDQRTYDWMERTFNMRIIKVELVEPYLYHLDCSVFPITRDQTLVCTELFTREEIAQIEEHTGILDVSVDAAFSGICNSVRLNNTILNASHLHDLKAGTEDYALELAKNRRLEDIASELAFEVSYFNLSEYHKSGALLSCMVMHLNRNSYAFTLL
jgi:N-dimethylarginine dimethylaminohydrolase